MRPKSPCSYPLLILWAAACTLSFPAPAAHSADAAPIRIYTELLDPREHPDYERRHVQPPSWETFDNRTQFATLRGFSVQDGKIINAAEGIERYTREYELGDVIWPSYPILFAENLDELLDEIAARELFLFDIWGYVPGSGPGGYWTQFEPPEGVFELMESKLGPRWLGMDVGEQDGRYVGGYASQMIPRGAGRFEQYLNLQRHFERMCNDLGNKMCTLLSLNFGHHFLKEGVYTLIGAETAQGLPNAQVYYAFIRGAGKQYGVPWFGNASIFNRWGWKVYGPEGGDGHYKNGPTKGTSLSLLKRLLYTQILWNSVCVGFENGWFDSEGRLSPIGTIQQEAVRWTEQHGQPGVMVTPVGVMIDFYAGWSFPRHLYTQNVYRVWGNLPYGPGDYLTDGVLDLLYPGYQDASYFHDETGFLTPTPYGDAADCLLSDAPAWLLDRYAVLVVAGELSGGHEIRDRLETYVENGGHLFITAGNLAKFPRGIAGVTAEDSPDVFPAGTEITVGSQTIRESAPFTLAHLEYPGRLEVLARCQNRPAAVRAVYGKGRISVVASPFGLSSQSTAESDIHSEIDKPLARPYPLLQHVRALLDETLRGQMLFEAGEGLSLITCRKAPGEYVLGICNNAYQEKPLHIVSHCGAIRSIEELPLDRSEMTAVGYLPESLIGSDTGGSSGSTIAGGDVRIFRVSVDEANVEIIPHETPPPRPRNRMVALRGIHSIKESILARPTFFEHYDGAMVDWRVLDRTDAAALQEETGWIQRQGLRVTVDLSSGINLYPNLRLVDNIQTDYEQSLARIESLMQKMEILTARVLVLTLHRHPENNFTREQTEAAFRKSLRELCARAGQYEITLHLRVSPAKPPYSIEEALRLCEDVDAPNLRIAPSAALLLDKIDAAKKSIAKAKEKIGIWLIAAPAHDAGGKLYTVHNPIADLPQPERLQRLLETTPDVPIILDALYPDQDAEYLDAKTLSRLFRN